MAKGLSPEVRQWIMAAGLVACFSTYYAHYFAESFEEGATQSLAAGVLIAKMIGVSLISISLVPIQFPLGLSAGIALAALTGLAVRYLVGLLLQGGADLLFLNLVLQLPVALALWASAWTGAARSALRVVAQLLAIQVIVDWLVALSGTSLWDSGAFVGGVGNPSSFGASCAVVLAFVLFCERASRLRLAVAILLAIGAAASQSLFALLSLTCVIGYWLLWTLREGMRRHLPAVVVAVSMITLLSIAALDADAFVWHKLRAAFAVLDLAEYDAEAATVSIRMQIHQEALQIVLHDPMALLFGSADQAYWPVDSQYLTYLISFGFLGPVTLVGITVLAIAGAAYRTISSREKQFVIVATVVFAVLFATNRILDYFPLATLYFLVFGVAFSSRGSDRNQAPASPSCPERRCRLSGA